ncbi:MAG: intermembrane transport protein PqiB [Gammaproteobacteria bacterium]|nr:intermembrane transport protein PqiB [Gammaproteobacteria bacterium]
MSTEQAVITQSSNMSKVWLIPLLALVLGASVVIHNWSTQGPQIELGFTTANGLEQGKTKVKYRNVDMGIVESVRLNDDFNGVVATVRLNRQASPLLREDTKFWVVTATVGIDRISGLDTLLSGAYIEMSPGTGEAGWRKFTALDKPPLTAADAHGLRIQLTSRSGTSVGTGDAVLFKGFKIGQVESTEFDPVSRLIRHSIFIDAPYDDLVSTSTRFWDVSGISMSASAEGLKIDTGSLDTVFLGGIALGNPPGIAAGEPVTHDAEFRLYDSYDDILENPYKFGTYYVVSFSQSVKGLLPGAPVEYRGIHIGKVERILLRETMESALAVGLKGQASSLPVLIYLEPARLEMPDRESSIQKLRDALELGVRNGMRASLESASLLTGAKFINLDYFEAAQSASMGSFMDYQEIPTVETGFDQLQQQVASILDTLSDLPLLETVETANAAIASLDSTLESLNGLINSSSTQQLPAEIEGTLRELRATLEGVAPGSPVYQTIDSSLLRLNRALQNLEVFTHTLAEQPNAVLLPSAPAADPIPEAGK